MGIQDRMRQAIRKFKQLGSADHTNQECNDVNASGINKEELVRSATESDKAEPEDSKIISQLARSAFSTDDDASKVTLAFREASGRATEIATALNAVSDDSNDKDDVIHQLSEIATNDGAAASRGLRNPYGSIGSDSFPLQYMDETR